MKRNLYFLLAVASGLGWCCSLTGCSEYDAKFADLSVRIARLQDEANSLQGDILRLQDKVFDPPTGTHAWKCEAVQQGFEVRISCNAGKRGFFTNFRVSE